jgi:hypothetical protein
LIEGKRTGDLYHYFDTRDDKAVGEPDARLPARTRHHDAQGPSHLAAQLQIIFGEGNCSFSGRMQGLLLQLKHEWDELERPIEEASAELQRIAKQDDACSRLMEISGIGPLVHARS